MFVQLILFFLFVLLLFYNFYWKRRHFPPGPIPLPLIGNILELNSDPPGYNIFKKWQNKYGNIYTYWMSEKPIVTVNDYKTMYEMFVKDGDTFAGRSDIGNQQEYIRGGPYGIIFVDGEIWKEHRKFAMQVFKNFGMGKSVMEEKIQIEIGFLISEIMESMNHNKNEIELNPIPLIDRTIANAINQMLFGFAFRSEKERKDYLSLKNTLTKFIQVGSWPSVIFGLSYPKIIPNLPYFKQQMNKFKACYWELRTYYTRLIDEHRIEMKKNYNIKEEGGGEENNFDSTPKDYVEAYLHEAAKTGKPYFNDDYLVNILADLWGAGQETTANTSIFSLLYILNNLEIQDKIHAELDAIIGSDRIITLANKNSLIYINAFINELHRCVNLIPQNLFHRTTKDVKYGIASASSELNTYNATTIVSVGKSGKPKYKVASFNYFGDFATLLTTSIIEYSLIAAAVMFVIWKSIDDEHNHHGGSGEHKHHKKKRSKLSVDFGASSGGLFAGVIFLIGSLVTIGIYSYYYQNKETKTAILVFRLSDLTLYCLALLACALAFYQIRHLQYVHSHASNAEFLDELLLFIGTMGEFISCSSGIYCWLISQKEINHMEVYYLFVLIIHLIQVFLQSLLIYLSIRLRALSINSSVEKPGRQYITFLLIANVSLFFFHTLESLKSVFGDSLSSERTRPYQYLVAAVLPLSLFYRFHSSVCLAEIWKHCYSVKHQTLTPASSLPTDHSPC